MATPQTEDKASEREPTLTEFFDSLGFENTGESTFTPERVAEIIRRDRYSD